MPLRVLQYSSCQCTEQWTARRLCSFRLDHSQVHNSLANSDPLAEPPSAAPHLFGLPLLASCLLPAFLLLLLQEALSPPLSCTPQHGARDRRRLARHVWSACLQRSGVPSGGACR